MSRDLGPAHWHVNDSESEESDHDFHGDDVKSSSDS